MASLRDILTSVVGGTSPSGEVTEPTERETVGKWLDELKQAKKFFESFHKQATKSNEKFVDEKGKKSGDAPGTAPLYRLNLYHADIITVRSMLYAKIPKAEADRRFYDPSDEVARVAAEMITRIIQNDMNDPDDKLNSVLKSALEDRLVAGLGSGRVKYSMTEKPMLDPVTQAPPVDPTTGQPVLDPTTQEPPTVKDDEWTDVIYTHWRDILWNPCRVESELRWKAFRSYMTKDEVTKRWGEEIATTIPYSTKQPRMTEAAGAKSEPIEKAAPEAEIWEIWDGEGKCVYWVVEGYDKFLDQKENPMELGGFYPDATPMLANTTTSKYLPKPDYSFAADLYAEIDELETRISLLTQAAKVVGVYDRASKDIARMLKEGVENELIPVDNWAMFAEKGGIKGMVDWLPLEQIVGAIETLATQQQNRIQQLYQVTGLSDIMRGQAAQQNVTATEQRIKAQYGSGRIQAIQEEFAEFASQLLNKKVQLIQRFYDPDRIKALSNIMNTPDAGMADQAIALIKKPDQFNCRVSVKSESMAQENKDAIKEQRSTLIQGVAQFLGMAQPFIEKTPASAPFLLQLLAFSVAGYNGASEMEGVIDQFAEQIKQQLAQAAANPQPPPPDPKMVAAQAQAAATQQKAQADAAAAQQEAVARQQELAQAQQESALKLEQMQADMVNKQKEHDMKMAEISAKLDALTQTTTAKLEVIHATADAKEQAAQEPPASA